MKTKKQEELVDSFLTQIENEQRTVYQEIIDSLSELGYHPHREKSSITFKHDSHNKQLAKMGIRTNKKSGSFPFFSLRFSACRGYSQRFSDIVSAYIEKYPTRSARCTGDGCNFCAGDAATHTYTHILSYGETKTHCGAYAIEIPDLSADDLPEIRKLLQEEHKYLLQHEVGRE